VKQVLVVAALLLVPAFAPVSRPVSTLAYNIHAAQYIPVCPGAEAGSARCSSYVVTNGQGVPLAGGSPPSGSYGPTQFHTGYTLPITGGSGQLIGIVDAYDDPSIASDLNVYDTQYGLPACTITNGCFAKVNQSGQAYNYPRTNSGWALEISLDVETAHEICQNCKIVLVEASSSSLANLGAAVNEAASLGATEISNSYGGNESSGETSYDSDYTHSGVAVTASSGDSGYGAQYPAASPDVVSVGGTTLNLNSNNTYGTESAWSSGGSGCSAYEGANSWQKSVKDWSQTGCGTKRGIADVSADADPNTGAAVYDSTKYYGQAGWWQVGGTSLSSPLIAGVFALAGGTSSYKNAQQVPYLKSSNLHDVTLGSNGNCSTIMCTAASGYDGPTGLGTPNGTGGF
jgi:subtilase family serine protease